MVQEKVGADEARRAAQHEAVMARIERSVNAEIGGQAAVAPPSGHSRIDAVAGSWRETAVGGMAQGMAQGMAHGMAHGMAQVMRALSKVRAAARGSSFIDYVFYSAYGLLAVRLVLALVAPQPGNGFVQFITTVTNPLFAPFRGVVASSTTDGGFTLVVPIMIASVAYALLHGAINSILRMVGHRTTKR